MEADDAWLLSAAEMAGAYALAGYFAGLVLVLLAVALAVRLLQRYPVRHSSGQHSLVTLLARFAFGFAAIVAAAAIFTSLADEIGLDDELTLMDARFTHAVTQHTPAPALRIFGFITHFGDTLVLIAIGIIVALTLLLLRQRWLMLGWVAAVAGNGLLNPALKAVFERVRPLDMHGLPLTEGWSFPSGHASGAVVVYGMLSYVLLRNTPHGWHLPIILLAALLAFSVGWSRIFLQYHYASDVLAGFASGGTWLAVCVGIMEYARWQHVWKPSSTA